MLCRKEAAYQFFNRFCFKSKTWRFRISWHCRTPIFLHFIFEPPTSRVFLRKDVMRFRGNARFFGFLSIPILFFISAHSKYIVFLFSQNNFVHLKKEFVFDRALAGVYARFLLHLFALFSQNRETGSFSFAKSGV